MPEAPAPAWKLFVSYTGNDLADHARVVAETAIAGGTWLIEDHVYWPTTGRPSVPECLAKVRECHALLLLSAHRKGWVPGPDEGGGDSRSICHLEWDAASGNPRAGLLADPAAPWGDASDPPAELRTEIEATIRGAYFGEDPESVRPLARHALTELDRQLTQRWDAARALAAAEGVLRPAYRTLPDEYPPSYLLRAEYRVVDFYGRDEELAGLEAWCLSGRSTGVRLVVGQGGAGKTRLAAELCERMQTHGWVAGFLERDLDDGAVDRLLAAELPALIVIDYAETRPGEVRQWLTRIGRTDRLPHDARILLVARGAGAWWEELRTEEAEYEALLMEQEHRLSPLTLDLESRSDLCDRAISGFRRHLERDAEIAAPGLEDGLFEEALWVLLAARSALDGNRIEHAQELLDDQIARERRYWRRSSQTAGLRLTPAVLGAVVSAATLAGADSRDEAVAMIGRLPELTGDDAPAAVARWLHGLYPGTGWLGGLQPDLLGEALIAGTIGRSPELITDVLDGASPDQIHQALTVLTRAARHHDNIHGILRSLLAKPEIALAAMTVAQETGDPIGRVLAETAASNGLDPETLAALYDRLPEHTTALRELAAVILSTRVDALRETDASPDRDATLAGVLNEQSVRLSDLGRREDALDAVNEAVTIYRGLAATRPDAFLPDLASSLNNLSNRLSALGRREDGLDAINEAVTIYRGLAATRPDAFLPDLAISLNNLSNRLSDLGRREDALAAINEAATIYRGLAATHSDTFLPDLASSLNNLSNRLSDLGQREVALAAIEEAVAIYRRLAATRPDAFLPNLAGSLNNLTNRFSELGRREVALAAIEEAVTIYRRLAATRPDAFLPNLATSLNNLTNCLSNLGHREDALAAIEEAVTIRRGLAATRPDAFLPDLASSLNNLTNCLSALGRREDALAAIEEAVTIRRGLAATRPDAFLPDLAIALNNLSNSLSDLGHREDALAAIENAVTIRRALAETRPDAFLPDLAMSLNNLSTRLSDLGRREDALDAVEEAIQRALPILERAPYWLPDSGLRLAQRYLAAAEDAGVEPDVDMLDDLIAILQRAGVLDDDAES